MSVPDQPDLLFFDTFSHDTSEELNLDLVQFPKSVYVREIRVIPLGARVEGDFPGGVRLGATNPTKFHIDFFVNDLSKPGASTFEALGSLEYCQNGQIHMECGASLNQPQIPTDGLVLRGCYTTITLAVYGNLTQIIPDTATGSNPPSSVQRQTVTREVAVAPAPVPPPADWSQDGSNPIPSYTGNVATGNPDSYGPTVYPENYDNQMYRSDYYANEPPKDPRTYHHIDDNEWEKERRDVSLERDRDRIRHSPHSLEHDRDRREGRSRRRSLDRGRSRESSRHRDRSRDLDRLERVHSRSRSRDRDYIVKGEYRQLSRSRSHSLDRDRMRGASDDRDWDRGSYKKDEYRRRDASYDRSRGGSYEPRSPYDKRAPSYERKAPYDKCGPSYEKRPSPYDKRSSSYERRAPSYEKQSSYDRKRHSPYGRVRGSSYGSRSPSRDDSRKRPRTPPGEAARRPSPPREGDASSPINSTRSEEGADYDRSGKQIPRIDFYHQSYRHKSSIRSPSQEVEGGYPPETPHSSLVTVQLVEAAPAAPPAAAPAASSPAHAPDEDRTEDAEQFEPILSDEDICDELEGPPFMEVEYDGNEYGGLDDVIKYYNPFKAEWTQYEFKHKLQLVSPRAAEGVRDVMTASFQELCAASPDLLKMYEITKAANKRDPKLVPSAFGDVDNTSREDWVHLCEQLLLCLHTLCRNTDIILRIFSSHDRDDACDEFADIFHLLITFIKIGLDFESALAQQQPTYKIRHIKCGVRLAEALLAHAHSARVAAALLARGVDVPARLLHVYAREYMALSIRLMILKSLNACLSSKVAIEHFMKETVYPKFDKKDDAPSKAMNGYRALIGIMETNPLARIKFALSSLIKKLNMYEVLGKLRELVAEYEGAAGECELGEGAAQVVVHALGAALRAYRSRCFHLSQPARFLPVAAQFDISRDCSNDILLQFFKIHQTFEVCLYLLTCPGTCGNLVITSPVHDLVCELLNSQEGLNFFYENMSMSKLLFETLTHPYGQQNAEEGVFSHDLSGCDDLQLLGLELAHRLRALYQLRAVADLQAGAADENELIDRLHGLYCLSFGNVGKTAVADVIVMGDNADCLMEVFESDLKNKSKSDSPSKQKSPAKGYAIELIVSAVRFSADVPFLKKYAPRLMSVAREHERFEPSVASVLQEVAPYLEPAERMDSFTGDDMAACVEVLKASCEHAPDLPGELTTCLRILTHFCISDRETEVSFVSEAAEEFVELKYKYNVLQLFSSDGVSHLVAILDRLATHFEQPSMHTAFFASTKGLQLAQILLPCLRLLDEMLARVVRCRGPRFRDLTAAPVLLKTYGLARAFPAGSIGFRTAARAAEAAVKALLAYAQPIADDATDGESIRRGPWTSLCAEVIRYTMTAPYTFVSGLLVFSELLPLPLPMQTRAAPGARELRDSADERRLWSAHLHALAADLTDMIRVICVSTYRPVVHMLRRVCVQLADLAPNTAATVARAAQAALLEESRPGLSCARALGFLACLVSHAPVKCAVLHAMNGGGARAGELPAALCGVLAAPSPGGEQAAAQELAAHALAALCDMEVTLIPTSAAPELLLANSLPNKEAMAAFLDATAACLETTRSSAVATSVLRAYFVMTEHEYGFQQFRKMLPKRRSALGKYFRWAAAGGERPECLALYLELVRMLRAEEGAAGRRGVLTRADLVDMVGYDDPDPDHPAFSLERLLKERNSDEEVISNAAFLEAQLRGGGGGEEAGAGAGAGEAAEGASPPPPPPVSLVAQFAQRTLHCSAGEAADERLSAGYWLSAPAPAPHDDVNDSELVWCDVVEVAAQQLGGAAGAGALAAGVRRLAGAGGDARGDALPADKRPAVALSRVRAEGGADAFRSRPPNTSRPPSLHVDDFTALHQPYPLRGRRAAGGTDRGRFASAAPPHHHYRQLRGRGAWELGQHFGHFAPASHYMMGMGWGGARMQRGPRHRAFMR